MRHLALLLLLAAGVTALQGCDTTGLDPYCTVNCPPTPAPPTPDPPTPDPKIFVGLDARGTYLRTNEDPGAQPAAVRTLGEVGLVAGGQACFEATGDLDLGGILARPSDIPVVMAVFSTSAQLGAADERYRVAGAVGEIEDIVTPVTLIGDLETDIAEDFNATATCAAVPPGATHVFFGTWDGFSSDNVGAPGDPYGVLVWQP